MVSGAECDCECEAGRALFLSKEFAHETPIDCRGTTWNHFLRVAELVL